MRPEEYISRLKRGTRIIYTGIFHCAIVTVLDARNLHRIIVEWDAWISSSGFITRQHKDTLIYGDEHFWNRVAILCSEM